MFRFTLRRLLFFTTLVGVALGLLGRELNQARSEQAAFRELLRRGASGDDWVGWKEIFLGREFAPVVQIYLPENMTIREALPLVRQLDNLESVEIGSHSVDQQELDDLREISWIDSLVLRSATFADDAVPVLAKFDQLRWLYLKGTQISDAGARQLAVALPNCRIER